MVKIMRAPWPHVKNFFERILFFAEPSAHPVERLVI